MIDWMSVIANGFWLVGLALVLAGFSYYYWLAGQMGQSLGDQLAGRPFQRVAVCGLLLVGIGLTLTAEGLWQILPAVALVLACLFALSTLLRRERNH
jgi:hypothetical protein